MPVLIDIQDAGVRIDDRDILTGIALSVEKGQRWAVVGRNGAGKSTLIRVVARLQDLSRGRVLVGGRDIDAFSPRDYARMVSYVPQAQGRLIPYRVMDYVLMGRFAYQGLFALPSSRDRAFAREALELTDTAHLADRSMDTLSGGELQRVLVAGAVSQRTSVLLLDEPTTFLDPLHQQSIRQALKRVHEETDATLVTITHDVNAAVEDATHVLGLLDGAVCFCGTSEELRRESAALLMRIYGLPFASATTSDGTRTVLVPGSPT